jgi:hypothetical protein
VEVNEMLPTSRLTQSFRDLFDLFGQQPLDL